jgi:nicotinamidase-related amidase
MLIELNYPEPVPVELKAEKTLLLVIDMENENAHPHGALYIGEPVQRIIPRIRELREKVRRAGAGASFTRNRCGHPMRSSSRFSRTRCVNWKAAGERR